MYLKRLTITGFKTFAAKTVISLQPGITAFVGPNGSGKSNVADAVRWAMGEQSKAKLRLSDKEEVVFAGSELRARASLAEVELVFDNGSGAFALDLEEVAISRRLYRNGETEYRLAGRPTKLSEIQLLLAGAQVGSGSYAVVGQGMIDAMLMASPDERKLLFNEASGIRADEIKRDAALKRLEQVEANLVRLRDIRAELEPRLADLARVAKAASRRETLEQELTKARAVFAASALRHFEGEESSIRATIAKTEARLKETELEAKGQVDAVTALEQEAAANASRHAEIQKELAEAERRWDQLQALVATQSEHATRLEYAAAEVARLESEAKKHRLAQQKATRTKGSVARELDGLREAVARSEKELRKLGEPVAEAQAVLTELREKSESGTQYQYINSALSVMKVMAQGLAVDAPSLEQLRLLVYKAGRLLSHAAKTGESEVLDQLEAAQVKLEAAMTRREAVTEHLTNLTLSVRSLEIDYAQAEALVVTTEEAVAIAMRELEESRTSFKALKAERDHSGDPKAQLEELRLHVQALRDQSARQQGADSQRLTAAVTKREQLRAAVETLSANLVSLQGVVADLAGRRRATDDLVAGWALTDIDAKPSAKPLDELQRAAELLQERLSAERTIQQEGAAEYEAVRTRYEDMGLQITDLETASRDLGEIITHLGTAITASFETEFAAIAQHFGRYFAQLFPGGSAKLSLVSTPSGSYGIDIKASPGGKRLSALAALSGGERALTGVALLAAILANSPNPFIVMDEIDAALDDANSGRLAGIFKDLSSRSQLIIITHNRQTMAAASCLYGITLNRQQFSQVASMRLETAQELAAR